MLNTAEDHFILKAKPKIYRSSGPNASFIMCTGKCGKQTPSGSA